MKPFIFSKKALAILPCLFLLNATNAQNTDFQKFASRFRLVQTPFKTDTIDRQIKEPDFVSVRSANDVDWKYPNNIADSLAWKYLTHDSTEYGRFYTIGDVFDVQTEKFYPYHHRYRIRFELDSLVFLIFLKDDVGYSQCLYLAVFDLDGNRLTKESLGEFADGGIYSNATFFNNMSFRRRTYTQLSSFDEPMQTKKTTEGLVFNREKKAYVRTEHKEEILNCSLMDCLKKNL